MNQDPTSPQPQPVTPQPQQPYQPQPLQPPAYQPASPQYAPQPPAVPQAQPVQPASSQPPFIQSQPAPQPQPIAEPPAFGPIPPQQPIAAPVQPVFAAAPPPQTPFQPIAQPAPFQGQPVGAAPAPLNPGKTLAIIGLILDFFFAPAGLVVSLVAKHKSKKAGQKNGIAVAGIILGIVFTLMGLAATVLIAFVFTQPFAECAKLGNGTHVVGNTTYVCAPGSVKVTTGTTDPSSNF